MEELPPIASLQTSLAPPSLPLESGLTGHDGTGTDWIDSNCTDYIDALLPPQISQEPLMLCPTENGIPLDIKMLDQGSSSVSPNMRSPKGQVVRPVVNNFLTERCSISKLTQKRAPKAPTISAKKWELHRDRIRQLYVTQKKTIKEVRDVMNKELGLPATIRQYKVQIQRMNIIRNTKSNECRAVVKHVRYRATRMSKTTGYIRVRGHDIDKEKLSRWSKEYLKDKSTSRSNTPSSLPSFISLHTKSVSEGLDQLSLIGLKDRYIADDTTSRRTITDSLVQRLLRYRESPNHIIQSQTAREIFNDLQQVLRDDYFTSHPAEKDWNPRVLEDVMQVRNLMNVTQKLTIADNLRDTSNLLPVLDSDNTESDLSELSSRHASWITPYGRVQASFWSVSKERTPNNGMNALMKTANEVFAAKLSIVQNDMVSSPFRLVFDFSPRHDPAITLAYQPLVPSDSVVFKVARYGEVSRLIELFQKRKATLKDHDEEGRSLLHYAVIEPNLDMCRFLLYKRADANEIGPESNRYLGPMNMLRTSNEPRDIETQKHAGCLLLLLEAGADLSLTMNFGERIWETAFMYSVSSYPLGIVKRMVDYGRPFIKSNGIYTSVDGECSALSILANRCGYYLSDSIDIVDKAILLLKHKADVSWRDREGNTVLHTVLRSVRLHERMAKTDAQLQSSQQLHNWQLSLEAPKDLLMAFITAGADVYSINNHGETLFMTASNYGREREWSEALESCGFEPEEIWTLGAIYPPAFELQAPTLPFEKYCQLRQQGQFCEGSRQDQTEYDDNQGQTEQVNACEEHDSSSDKPQPVGAVVNQEVHQFGIGVDNANEGWVPGNLNYENWLDNGLNYMNSYKFA
ncbi:Ankyrin repeat-containing protein [Glarea lozoyensis ATCC 20868]|uniref:Ankyrin repeat-containing protein n=1 Tax=Glarea lozoyensis (strain ATCC 20868 / MF5171) TaxID=1116229 RepID=S3CGP0_GLAL2|nr:Ankyrin repeat-containing protein [Glarea lozoyensis ATCC 20868]EPE24439.1 Ankyrin repeat-containing protein [Glarea lozoyensis ATCC 20868]